MPVINRDLVSHHANRVLFLVAGDDDGPLTPASDVIMLADPLEGRFRAVDSDGVGWVITVQPADIQDAPAHRCSNDCEHAVHAVDSRNQQWRGSRPVF